MLNKERLGRVNRNLDQIGLRQMIITDPMAIFYLTGKTITAQWLKIPCSC